uniref:C-type lectin domain-containing protein n=1 Tax=Panagrellus redivivus TaxID=6233 RepID=A0A7E4VJK0_PANRE
MATSKWLFVTIAIAVACVSYSEGACSTPGLIKKLQPTVLKITNFTTTTQNSGIITVLVNCSFYENNASTCGTNFYNFVKGNLTSAQMSSAVALGSKYALAGGSITTALDNLEVAIIKGITPKLWTPLKKKAKKLGTYAKYECPALKYSKKTITTKYICNIATSVKTALSSSWSAAKSAFAGIFPAFALCGL